MEIAIWGAGNLGEAMVAGMVRNGVPAASIFVSNRVRDERLAYMHTQYGVRCGRSLTNRPDVLLLCMKPYQVEDVASVLRSQLHPDTVIVSCLAAVTVDRLHALFDRDDIVRAMPNLNAEIGRSFTALYAKLGVTEEHTLAVQALFECVGSVEWVDERSLDSLTILSGAGPAMIATFWRALLDASGDLGIAEATAAKALGALFQGTPERLLTKGISSQEMIAQVATRGGVTEALLTVLREQGWSRILGEAFQSAAQRNLAIGRG